MADMANIVVYDDATTPVVKTFIPMTSDPSGPTWIENSTTLSQIAKGKISTVRTRQKNGLTRRLFKVEIPVMETPSIASPSGYNAPPKVAYVVSAQISLLVHERATGSQIADALKMCVNGLLGDAAAGTGDAYKNATGQIRQFLIGDILPG